DPRGRCEDRAHARWMAAVAIASGGRFVLRLGNQLNQCRAFAARIAGLLLIVLLQSGTPAAAAWTTFGGNPQHTAVSPTTAQALQAIHWSTAVDLAPPAAEILIHYGSPLVTAANTVIVPVKTGSTDGFRIDARSGTDGALIWSQTTDYILPPHGW